jgi:5-methylcytosine-specific restriction endonuclease McrA
MSKHPEAKPPYAQPSKTQCRWCWGQLAPRRRTFCSARCVDEFRAETDWNYVRRAVYKRDRGVCALCGCDTSKLYRVLRWAHHWEWANNMPGVGGWSRAIRSQIHGTKRPGAEGGYEVDHILPRELGGTNELANLRTLCVGCHADVTRKQAADRAARRRTRGAA